MKVFPLLFGHFLNQFFKNCFTGVKRLIDAQIFCYRFSFGPINQINDASQSSQFFRSEFCTTIILTGTLNN